MRSLKTTSAQLTLLIDCSKCCGPLDKVVKVGSRKDLDSFLFARNDLTCYRNVKDKSKSKDKSAKDNTIFQLTYSVEAVKLLEYPKYAD